MKTNIRTYKNKKELDLMEEKKRLFKSITFLTALIGTLYAVQVLLSTKI